MSDLCVWQRHSCAWYDSCVRATVRQASPCVTVCDLAHSCVRHESFVCATWLVHACDGTASEPLCDTTHLHSRVTWLIRACDMNHLFVQLNFWVRASATWAYVLQWLIRAGDITHFCVQETHTDVCLHWQGKKAHMWHDSFVCVTTGTREPPSPSFAKGIT